MRIDQALVARKLVESRQEAQFCIEEGYVTLNGVPVTKSSKDTKENDIIVLTKRRTYVSRGGEKLDGALQHFFIHKEAIETHLKGKTALDAGSSTGGFTDCLLSYCVSSVDAVDVGTSQLHPKLRDDKRVHVYENTDIRNFTTETSYDVIVADLSFIPLAKVVETIISFSKKGTYYFLLIKPQFEVGKGNTKKGIVKDVSLIQTLTEEYLDLAKVHHIEKATISPCVIQGGDGNQEYFLTGIQG
jgi:23S rRNA (cytidine1920-2'-O)/16S rRNA (cytidine1409-2'-O)-methyltransferase